MPRMMALQPQVKSMYQAKTMIMQPYSYFNFATVESSSQNQAPILGTTSLGSNKKITAKTLCDITGTRYYPHNEEIGFGPDRIVRVYDENDVLIGDMTFQEAQDAAAGGKKDLVLRNSKIDPPVTKIMLYKLELLKRLFKKLGRQGEEKDSKSKTFRLTTTISLHDLDNKKKKAIEYLKTYSGLKFYMKVNIYDEENVQKGRLMLMNIAEDLKEYGKVKVSPMVGASKQVDSKYEQNIKASGGKKPSKIEDIKKGADKQRASKDDIVSLEDGEDDDEDIEGRSQYVYMELQSTVAFKEIDIDKMLEHTSLDDFLRGLYVNSLGQTPTGEKKLTHHEKMMGMIASQGQDQGSAQDAPTLAFEEQDDSDNRFSNENLRKQAMENLKELKRRQKYSQIFNQGDQAKQADIEEEVQEIETDITKQKRIDLTKTQIQQNESEQDKEFDEFDLIEQNVDPKDIKTILRISQLENEIELEKIKIKIKHIFKFSMQAHDPMKICE
ncbi:translation initiation factor if-3 [Stylonychia lemnae]|uniref:Translation initiation factor if-3 n=1 Tax=Stylonychia lemnae TaxID=5949 RepID=A0A078B449_STYLE|nr:translation initiation factor if-3 [Stylonychia lemnae]|eukprot:CDW89021.1 translation initiation factor if-3 [Stylonychia lemnae]